MNTLSSQELVLAVEETLTIANMRAWASSFPADQVLGHASKGADCPIARFLRSRLQEEVFVGRGMWTTDWGLPPSAKLHELPSWAKHFVWVVDTCFTDEVTAEQVRLALLDAERHVFQQFPVINWSEIQAMAAATPVSLKAEEKVLVPA